MINKQLEQAKLIVVKDEEIRFWKCTLIELICGEILNNFTKEKEFFQILNSSLSFSDKFSEVKERLTKYIKVKHPQVLKINTFITEKSFIFSFVKAESLICSLVETILNTQDEIHLVVYKDFRDGEDIFIKSCEDIQGIYESIVKGAEFSLINVASNENLWILDGSFSKNPEKLMAEVLFDRENCCNLIRQAFLGIESVFLLVE